MESLVKIPEIKFEGFSSPVAKEEMLKVKILAELKKLPNPAKFKLDASFTTLVCTIVEHAIKDNKIEKVNKKEIVSYCLSNYTGLSEAEKLILDQQIEFLLNNKLVKKIKKTFYKIVKKTIKQICKKKD
jgi:hypothetical protein